MHPDVEEIASQLKELGHNGEVLELNESTRTALDAATALSCAVGAIANSLIFMASGTPVLILTSGAHRVDTEFVAELIGACSLRRASADEVRTATGQVIGGVAPLGHANELPVYIDTALRSYPKIWAAAGTANSVFSSTFEQLQQLTAAKEIAVTET